MIARAAAVGGGLQGAGWDTDRVQLTHSYVGTTLGRYRYLFFALYNDYNDFDRAFVQEFHVYLERLARNLRDEGAVIQPFRGDIESARSDVLSKSWTGEELEQIRLVPSLLVISKNFDEFSPRSDPWLILHFGERRFGSSEGLAELSEAFEAITDSVTDLDSQPGVLFDIAHALLDDRPSLGTVFELRPTIFGCSIDLLQAGAYLRELIRSRRRPVGRQPSA